MKNHTAKVGSKLTLDSEGESTTVELYSKEGLDFLSNLWIKVAAERAVNRKVDAMGYKVLVGMGLQGLTFESVIVKFPDSFSPEAVKQAHKRLEELKNELEPTLWPYL